MTKKMTLAEMEERLDEITTRLWFLDMADRLYGQEKAEWEKLEKEKTQLIEQIRKLKEN